MGKRTTGGEFATARQRAEEAAAVEPRGDAAFYDEKRNLILVELKGGAWFGFRPYPGSGLEDATPAQLAEVEVAPGAYGLRWESLDADISLPGLMYEMLNVRQWAARWIGRHTSAVKAATSRENGKKGGRPRKVVTVERLARAHRIPSTKDAEVEVETKLRKRA